MNKIDKKDLTIAIESIIEVALKTREIKYTKIDKELLDIFSEKVKKYVRFNEIDKVYYCEIVSMKYLTFDRVHFNLEKMYRTRINENQIKECLKDLGYKI